jgi:hypothetical protein
VFKQGKHKQRKVINAVFSTNNKEGSMMAGLKVVVEG